MAMPRTQFAGDDEGDSSQVVSSDFLSPLEHVAIGNDPPHHARKHAIESQADHFITGTPSNGQILVYRTVDGNWHVENPSAGASGKSGVLSSGLFTGTPRKATVTFVTPFSDSNYVIQIGAIDVRAWSYESKTANGFTISTNANKALSSEVSWRAVASEGG
jgi:hypothetical protein